jgi:hypothetical protein
MAQPPELSDDDLDRWCARVLGSPPSTRLFEAGYLSRVVGLRLADGREVVVKVRQASPRLTACVAAHQRLHERGFPCPEPLSDAVAFSEGLVATAEKFVAGDELLPGAGRSAALFAPPFARLIRLAPTVEELPSLRPPLPWTGWNHDEGGLWPWPDDKDVDLNASAGPAWIDDAGRRAQNRLRAAGAANHIVGHGDWYAGNLRWSGDDLLVVHDWDSVIADTEAALVGFAAAVFPTTRPGDEATVVESDEFLAAYQSSANRRFDRDEMEVAWAAGCWLRAFDAKKQSVVGEPVASLTELEAAERLRRAGA